MVFLGVGFAGPRSHRRFSRNSTTIRISPVMMLSGVPASVGPISKSRRCDGDNLAPVLAMQRIHFTRPHSSLLSTSTRLSPSGSLSLSARAMKSRERKWLSSFPPPRTSAVNTGTR